MEIYLIVGVYVSSVVLTLLENPSLTTLKAVSWNEASVTGSPLNCVPVTSHRLAWRSPVGSTR